MVSFDEDLNLDLTRHHAGCGELGHQHAEVVAREGHVGVGLIDSRERRVPSAPHPVVQDEVAPASRLKLRGEINGTTDRRRVLRRRRGRIFSADGQEAVERQFREQAQEGQVDATRVPRRVVLAVVPRSRGGFHDHGVALVSRARGQIIRSVHRVEVQTVGRLPFQNAPGVGGHGFEFEPVARGSFRAPVCRGRKGGQRQGRTHTSPNPSEEGFHEEQVRLHLTQNSTPCPLTFRGFHAKDPHDSLNKSRGPFPCCSGLETACRGRTQRPPASTTRRVALPHAPSRVTKYRPSARPLTSTVASP